MSALLLRSLFLACFTSSSCQIVGFLIHGTKVLSIGLWTLVNVLVILNFLLDWSWCCLPNDS